MPTAVEYSLLTQGGSAVTTNPELPNNIKMLLLLQAMRASSPMDMVLTIMMARRYKEKQASSAALYNDVAASSDQFFERAEPDLLSVSIVQNAPEEINLKFNPQQIAAALGPESYLAHRLRRQSHHVANGATTEEAGVRALMEAVLLIMSGAVLDNHEELAPGLVGSAGSTQQQGILNLF